MASEPLARITDAIARKAGERDAHATRAAKLERQATDLAARLATATEARALLQRVAEQTQAAISIRVGDLVTRCLAAIFPDPYAFRVDFVSRRGQSEADLLFERRGETLNALDGSGGGPVDVAAFALRVCLWALRRPRTRPLLVLDEPFRFLSRDLQPRAGDMLGDLSRRLGLQFILVTHIPDLADAADRSFLVTQGADGRSVVARR